MGFKFDIYMYIMYYKVLCIPLFMHIFLRDNQRQILYFNERVWFTFQNNWIFYGPRGCLIPSSKAFITFFLWLTAGNEMHLFKTCHKFFPVQPQYIHFVSSCLQLLIPLPPDEEFEDWRIGFYFWLFWRMKHILNAISISKNDI